MPKLQSDDKKNFQTLSNAFEQGRVCLLDVQRVSDGKSVAAICTVIGPDERGLYGFTPFALMVEGNPFELFRSPSVEKGSPYYHNGGPPHE